MMVEHPLLARRQPGGVGRSVGQLGDGSCLVVAMADALPVAMWLPEP